MGKVAKAFMNNSLAMQVLESWRKYWTSAELDFAVLPDMVWPGFLPLGALLRLTLGSHTKGCSSNVVVLWDFFGYQLNLSFLALLGFRDGHDEKEMMIPEPLPNRPSQASARQTQAQPEKKGSIWSKVSKELALSFALPNIAKKLNSISPFNMIEFCSLSDLMMIIGGTDRYCMHN